MELADTDSQNTKSQGQKWFEIWYPYSCLRLILRFLCDFAPSASWIYLKQFIHVEAPNFEKVYNIYAGQFNRYAEGNEKLFHYVNQLIDEGLAVDGLAGILADHIEYEKCFVALQFLKKGGIKKFGPDLKELLKIRYEKEPKACTRLEREVKKRITAFGGMEKLKDYFQAQTFRLGLKDLGPEAEFIYAAIKQKEESKKDETGKRLQLQENNLKKLRQRLERKVLVYLVNYLDQQGIDKAYLKAGHILNYLHCSSKFDFTRKNKQGKYLGEERVRSRYREYSKEV